MPCKSVAADQLRVVEAKLWPLTVYLNGSDMFGATFNLVTRVGLP